MERVFLRQYPHHEIGAHLFGTVGEMTEKQLKDPRYRDVELGDRVGQSGIELPVRPLPARQERRQPRPGRRAREPASGELSVRRSRCRASQLRLSIDLDVQEAGQQALAGGTGRGAFVVMDVHSGEVLGLGSQPVLRPERLLEGHQQPDYKRLYDPDNGAPLTNRAIQGGYPDRLHVQAGHRHRGARERA